MEHKRENNMPPTVSPLEDRRVFRLLVRLAFPAMIGLLVNTLYTMVDMLFVGHAVGPAGIAALGISMGGYLILTGTALMVGVGGGSLISRQLGAREPDAAGETAFVSIIGMLILSGILGGGGLLFFPHVANALGASKETYPLVRGYLGVILAGAPFITLATVSNAQLRAQGKAREAMIANIIGNGCNLLLDALLIIVFGWGVTGAAVATICAQTIAAWYAFHILSSASSSCSISRGTDRDMVRMFGSIVVLGSPTLVRQLGTSVVTIVVNRSLLAHGGTLAIAAYGIIGTLLMFFNMPISGIVQGFQPIAGYHAGAHRFRESGRVLKGALLATFLTGSLLLLLVSVAPRLFLGLFTADERLLAQAEPGARLLFLGLPLLGIQSVGTAFFQAIGKAVPALVLWTTRQFVLLVPLIFLLGDRLGERGIYLAFPITDLFAALFILTLALHQSRLMHRRV